MNRRSSIASFFQSGQAKMSALPKSMALPVGGGLNPYSGPWTYATAAHLLRRTTFGPTHQMISDAVKDGLDKTLDKLLTNPYTESFPLNTNFANDPDVPVGETWVGKKGNFSIQGVVGYRQRSLWAWSVEQLYNEGLSIRERMTLFWHNHFVTDSNNVYDPRFSHRYIALLRKNALGNFKQLTKEITVDPAMLVYLNGNQNTKAAPNENYARELLELFTLGKGDLAGPGDYTTYTEADILEIAKVLTGWRTSQRGSDTEIIDPVFVPNLHDTSTKKLGNRFNNVSISNANEKEYLNLIDILFKKREAATFICRKLYRYFLYYKVDASIESEIVDKLADVLISNNFEMIPLLKTLLSSDHFFSDEAYGAMIKSPYEFLFSTIKSLGFALPQVTTLPQKYLYFGDIYQQSVAMQQAFFDHPNVAGWSAYYQEPSFYQIWINSVTLPYRMTFNAAYVNKSVTIRGVQTKLGLDLIVYIEKFASPSDVNKLIEDISAHLLPEPLAQNQIDYLKQALLVGSPDYEWTVEYNAYKANPNTTNRRAIETRLIQLFNAILTLPEYFLS